MAALLRYAPAVFKSVAAIQSTLAGVKEVVAGELQGCRGATAQKTRLCHGKEVRRRRGAEEENPHR